MCQATACFSALSTTMPSTTTNGQWCLVPCQGHGSSRFVLVLTPILRLWISGLSHLVIGEMFANSQQWRCGKHTIPIFLTMGARPSKRQYTRKGRVPGQRQQVPESDAIKPVTISPLMGPLDTRNKLGNLVHRTYHDLPANITYTSVGDGKICVK